MHLITPLGSNIDETQLSQNQRNKIQLNLSYALGRRMEIDSYLKSIKQSISILDKHVAQLKEDNADQIALVEGNSLLLNANRWNEPLKHRVCVYLLGILHEMESHQACSKSRGNAQYQRRSNKPVEDEAESAYASALSLAQTFEGAKNVLISMNVETVDGKAAPSLPWLNRIKLCLMNQIDDKAVNAAGLNILSFILLLQLQQNCYLQHKNLSGASSLQSTSATAIGSSNNTILRSILRPHQVLANQYCFLEVEVNFDRVNVIRILIGIRLLATCEFFSNCRKRDFFFNFHNKLRPNFEASLFALFHLRMLAIFIVL